MTKFSIGDLVAVYNRDGERHVAKIVDIFTDKIGTVYYYLIDTEGTEWDDVLAEEMEKLHRVK